MKKKDFKYVVMLNSHSMSHYIKKQKVSAALKWQENLDDLVFFEI